MANLSKEKRDKMIAYLEKMRELHSDDESLIMLNEIENSLTEKRYGLVFEEHSEAVDDMLRNNIPVLVADEERRLCKDESLPWNFIIEGDNLQALYILEKTHRGKVDCIYIDPPYNTGARDWKYNNDYVDSIDGYRHSKWLSMMKSRLTIAKRLLTKEGVMIIAIDDYEFTHLSLLLEDVFPEYDISPVIVNHHPQGGAADNISRTHEYAIFLTPKGKKLIKGKKTENVEEEWSLMRGGTDIRNLRKGRPNSFYAIYVDKETLKVVDVGRHLDADTIYDKEEAPEGCYAFYPIGKDGTERVWRYERESMRNHIQNGDIICSPKLTLKVINHKDVKYEQVFSVWTDGRYNAGTHGTNLTYEIFGSDNRFSYPKSLYTVKDCIEYSIQNKPNAIILDFFAGSGTTQHAVELLNSEDGGHRICIMVTNNEISEAEEKDFISRGINKGDPEWEEKGIAKYVTWPRTVCTIEGKDVKGNPLKGNYLGSNMPMSDGFRTNVKYLKCDWISREDNDIVEKITQRIKELIELEHAIEVDGTRYALILSEDDADEVEANWSDLNILGLYISHGVLLTSSQNILFDSVEKHIIPDYYYDIELKEVGESW